jgi:hypothetical protein
MVMMVIEKRSCELVCVQKSKDDDDDGDREEEL